MKTFSIALIALALAGCHHQSVVTVSDANNHSLTFKADRSETLRRNDIGEVSLRVERRGFDDAMAVDVEGLPQGVRVLNAPLSFESGQDRLILHLEASNDAELVTERVVTVRVHGPETLAATDQFKLTVKPSR